MIFVPQESIEALQQNIAMQRSVGISTRIVSREEARELAPAFHLDEGEAFAWEPESGHGDPSGTALAYAASARELGAQVVLRSPALAVEVSHGRVTAVVTERERYETPIAVVATGPCRRASSAGWASSCRCWPRDTRCSCCAGPLTECPPIQEAGTCPTSSTSGPKAPT